MPIIDTLASVRRAAPPHRRIPRVIAPLAFASLLAATALSPAGPVHAVAASRVSVPDPCDVAVPSATQPTDGPFSTRVSVMGNGYTLTLSPYPGHTSALVGGARATIDQFAFAQPNGAPTYEGLVYVYQHGTRQHVCGSGRAVANRRSRPTYTTFSLDATVTPTTIAATIQLGAGRYYINSYTQVPGSNSSSSTSTADRCDITAPVPRTTDGPFYSGTQVISGGDKLWFSPYPGPITGGAPIPVGAGGVRATVDQFAFSRPGAPTFEGLVNVYRHGATLHICAGGRAVANRQSSTPTYTGFQLEATVMPARTTAIIQLGLGPGAVRYHFYRLAGPTQPWHTRQ